ncbi:hypothetical protein [Tautonia marina]|uniref:hypothetical protein n=1 Tax=Tautonia marina TaxID=2653855 RepID=UPI0012606F02|nr:hypothetical protein [Tautonia marina]
MRFSLVERSGHVRLVPFIQVCPVFCLPDRITPEHWRSEWDDTDEQACLNTEFFTIMANFEQWLAGLLGQREYAAKQLLEDRTGLHFLIAWSLFESKCFSGNFEARKLLVDGLLPDTSLDEQQSLQRLGSLFHARYQDDQRLFALAPKEFTPQYLLEELRKLLQLPRQDLSAQNHRFICLFVASRVRNNMFHGMKGIDDWLRDKELIEQSTEALQVFVSAAERDKRTLAPEVA